MATFIEELRRRGRIAQVTDEAGLARHLGSGRADERRAYIGYDPTADSLTIGNMTTIMLLAHFQRAGHTPVVVAGGGTGLIGDPSGKSSERQLLTREKVAENVRSQMRIFGTILDFSPGVSNRAVIVDNADWLTKMSFLDALRDVGKHFRVNEMIQRDSVRDRLENREQGISYTEFSYMILQAYDFLHLHRSMGVTLQMGGSDQWGNIVAGTDLIRKVGAATGQVDPVAFGLTTPLVTKADGTKFGKTESGAVWMTADRTSPYALYQFWLNADDSLVVNYLNTFTFLPVERIAELADSHARNPGQRDAHRALAAAATELLHGPTERANAELASKALFSGDVSGLPEKLLDEVFANVPGNTFAKSRLDGAGVPLLDFLVETALASSKREAKEFLAGGSVLVNGEKAAADAALTAKHLLHGKVTAIRRGKKNWFLARWA
ncbi:MAG: tyrosyl-tRNA synthetase [Planctomycetota bacterium]|jgi:tyrosyl-tRNA synthetase